MDTVTALKVVRPYLAGLAAGFWSSGDEIASQWRVERRFEPAMPPSRVEDLRARWTEALERSKGWERS